MTNKVILKNTFFKSLSKLSNEDQEQQLKEKLIKDNLYLPRWRKHLSMSYNKKYTLRLAKALISIKPEWSIYQAKIFLTDCYWWDYSWFYNKLIRLFDEDTADKINQLSEYLELGGKTHYEKVNTKEYEDALSKWWNQVLSNGTEHVDGSFTIGNAKKTGDLAILEITDKDKEIMQKEVEQETREMGEIIATWIKNNPQYRDLICLFLDAWARSYRCGCYNADWRKVTNQMLKARQAILAEDWKEASKQFSQLNGWWD